MVEDLYHSFILLNGRLRPVVTIPDIDNWGPEDGRQGVQGLWPKRASFPQRRGYPVVGAGTKPFGFSAPGRSQDHQKDSAEESLTGD